MIKHQEYDIDGLKLLLNENILRFGIKNRFIHPRTVENFLIHFYLIKDRKRRDHIYSNISQYLNVLTELESENISAKIGLQLFDEYIGPIHRYYSIYGGFSLHLKWYFMLAIIVGIFFISSIVKFSIYLNIGIILLFVILILHKSYKAKLNKTYGLYY